MTFCVPRGRHAQSTYLGLSAVLVGTTLLCFVPTKESSAQSTVVIGGSGRPAIEVNLEVLDPENSQYPEPARRLRMPGERTVGILHLRAPAAVQSSQAPATATRLSIQHPSTPNQLRIPQQTTAAIPAVPAPKVVRRAAQTSVAPRVSVRTAPPAAKSTAPGSDRSSAHPQIVSKSAALKTPPSLTAAPRLSLQRPSTPNQLRVPQQTLAAMPAVPAPKVTQRSVQTSVAPEVSVRTAPPAAKSTAPRSNRSSAHLQITSKRGPSKIPPSLAAKPEGAVQQTASLPRVNLPRDGGQILRINFLGASTRLTPDAERGLASLAATVVESDGRLQLKAYAGGTVETLSSARRLSLSRALAVRSFLIEQRIRSTRIDVRALGRAEDSGPPERVDIILLSQ